jgi:hypothetical protein
MKIGAKAKREAIARTFGNVPPHVLDAAHVNFLYARRHCGTVPGDGDWRELAYVDEHYQLEETITATLDRIRDRDGNHVMREVARRLAETIEDIASRPVIRS